MSYWQALQILATASAATCGAICFVGWRRRSAAAAATPATTAALVRERCEPGRTPFSGEIVDIGRELRTLLAAAAPIAARRGIRLEYALQPGLQLRIDRHALREVLADLLTHACDQTTGGGVLVGARRHDRHIQITVCDDGSGQDASTQQGALRDTAQLLALQGASMQVDVRPGQGTSISIRLPVGAEPAPATPHIPAGAADPAAAAHASPATARPTAVRG